MLARQIWSEETNNTNNKFIRYSRVDNVVQDSVPCREFFFYSILEHAQ